MIRLSEFAFVFWICIVALVSWWITRSYEKTQGHLLYELEKDFNRHNYKKMEEIGNKALKDIAKCKYVDRTSYLKAKGVQEAMWELKGEWK